MKKILVYQNGKKQYLSAQEIYDNIDTTGYDIVLNQDTFTSSTGVNGHGFAGVPMSVTYDETIFCFFVFNSSGEWEYYESVVPHSVVALSAIAVRETRFNSNMSLKYLFDNLFTYCSGATDYDPAEKGGTLDWNPTAPINSKWILLRRDIDTNIRYQNIAQKNNSFALLPKKVPLCMNISDYSLSAGEFEKVYQYNHVLKLKDL